MGTNRTTWMAAVLGTVAVAGMMGCQKDAEKALGMGSASINANVKLAIGDVASLTVVVQGGSMASPITVPLVKKGNIFSALVSDLPVGTNYAFTASAKDASNVQLYHGAVSNQTIIKNQVANIVINMNQDAAAQPLSNNAPVIDYITATSLAVSQNDKVTINAGAHDPDAGQTALMGWGWTSTCGSLGTATTVSTTNPATSQIVFTAPAADGPCSVNLTVTDANGVLKNVASLTITVNAAAGTGNAKITAIPDTYPVISALTADLVPLNKGVATTLHVDATDADGDALNYHWTSPCAGVFGTPTAATTTFTLDGASAATSCDMVVVVDDGNFPDGTPKGGVIANHLTLPVFSPTNNVAVGAPVFGYDYQSQDTISGGDVVKMAIVANQGCAAPGVITLAWASSDNQVLGAIGPASIPLDATLFNASAASYTAPAGAEDGQVVTITVTATCSTSLLATGHSFTLVPLNSFCFGKGDNTDCTATAQGSNKCVQSAKCVNAVCVAQDTKSCSQVGVDQCKVNACVPSTGACVVSNKQDNTTSCNDGNACTGENNADVCVAGACTGAAKTCATPANVCQKATCNTSTGVCGVANDDGKICSDNLACTTSDVCTAGVCGGQAVICQNAGDVCSEPDGSCGAKICMQPSNAKKWVPPIQGVAVGPTGTPWAVGNIYNPFNFGSGTVQSTGSADVYLIKLDPATNLAAATYTMGDAGGANGKDQTANGVAVASLGNVGIIGASSGNVFVSGAHGTNDVNKLTSTGGSTPFYAVLNGTSGAGIAAHWVNVGSGALLSVASNPNQNAIAFCGKTNTMVSAAGDANVSDDMGVIAGTYGNTTAGGDMDIIVAKLDGATGQVIWGEQFGGTGDQLCESIAMDNNGDVIIAGSYNGNLNFGGATAALGSVSDSSLGILFVAKLQSADGKPLVAQAFGAAGRTDAYSVTVDGSSNIIVAGSLGGSIAFGGGVSVTNAGLTDAFVAKFTSAIVPVWAKAFGDANYDQTAKTVGVASNGDVFVGGSFKGGMSLPQAAGAPLALASASNTALDAWTAQLASADGAALCAHAYGDAAGAQAVSSIAVARAATGSLANAIFIGGAFSSQIQLGSSLLDTGSASIPASYISRLTP